jgi:hypothetical protein
MLSIIMDIVLRIWKGVGRRRRNGDASGRRTILKLRALSSTFYRQSEKKISQGLS